MMDDLMIKRPATVESACQIPWKPLGQFHRSSLHPVSELSVLFPYISTADFLLDKVHRAR